MTKETRKVNGDVRASKKSEISKAENVDGPNGAFGSNALLAMDVVNAIAPHYCPSTHHAHDKRREWSPVTLGHEERTRCIRCRSDMRENQHKCSVILIPWMIPAGERQICPFLHGQDSSVVYVLYILKREGSTWQERQVIARRTY